MLANRCKEILLSQYFKMSSLGRGRGYAGRRLAAGELRPGDPRLGPPAGTPRPGDSDAAEDPELGFLLHIDEVYRPILDQLERLTPGEDGIALNRKLTEIEATIASCVSNQSQMSDAFRSIRAMCLRDEKTALKCSLAMSVSSLSRTIPLKNSADKTLRNYYLNVMEETFGKLDVLERSDPQYLVNATNMLSSFYGEARLADGSALQLLAQPLLGYFEALLRNDSPKAHICLATQLILNGRRLLSAEQLRVERFCVDVHVRFLRSLRGEAVVAAESAPWLLLAADLCVNRFMPLPTKLQHFYAATLNLGGASDVINSMESQASNAVPSDTCFEVVYGSWRGDAQGGDGAKAESEAADHGQDNCLGGQDNCVNSADSACSAGNVSMGSSADSQTGGRKPRPILGAGARLARARGSVPDAFAVENAFAAENAFTAENAFAAGDATPQYYLAVDRVHAKPPEPPVAYKQAEPAKPSKPLSERSPAFRPAGDAAAYQWKPTSAGEDTFADSVAATLEFKPPQQDDRCVDPAAVQDTKAFLSKRHDLNSWRLGGDQENRAFQSAPGRRRGDRNGGGPGKDQAANWREHSWADDEARDSDSLDPAADSSNSGYAKFSNKFSPKENGRWDKGYADGGRRDRGAAAAAGGDAGRWERPPSDSPKRRTVLSAPRNTKYWDHDDRLERNYDE